MTKPLRSDQPAWASQADGRLAQVLLGALIFVLGAQSIRFLLASIAWYLRDTVGIGTLDLVPIALGPFILGAVFPIASRWLTVKRALWSAVGLLAATRLINQISTNPDVDFWMSAAGAVAFVGSLPLLLSLGRDALVAGVLLGLAVDSAIKGLSLSLDLSFQSGLVPVLAVAAIGLAALYLLRGVGRVERSGPAWGSGGSLIAIGPFLFAQFLILQNQGWLSQMIGIPAHEVSLRIALLNAVALFLVPRFERSRLLAWASLAVLVGVVLVAEFDSRWFNWLSLLGIPAAALVWARFVPDPDKAQVASSGVYHTIGMTLFVIIGLAYYLPLDLRLPFESSDVRIATAAILAIFGIAAMTRPSDRWPGVPANTWVLAAFAAVLPLVTVIVGATASTAEGADDQTVRIMSYNVHSAFNTSGVMDVEDLARVIEDSGAEIVGLQEVPRGRLMSGITDLFALLQNRLGFEHAAFFGTTDPTWGNAILSRFPIESVGRAYLPRAGTPMQRGYLGTEIQMGDQRFLFINTHLQHINDSDAHDEDPEADLYPVHREQVETILQEWGGRQPAVLVGDFNARPGWRQIEEVLAEGFVDSWDEVGVGDGFTSSADDPRYRIDYVFHTPDLKLVDADVIPTQASDHLPVVVDLER